MFIIPMAGKSSRFFDAGYTKPKYQLELEGNTVFSLAVKSFERYFSTDKFLFMIRDDFNTPQFVENEINKLGIGNYSIKVFTQETLGQADTVFKGLKSVPDSTPIYIFNIDTFRPSFVKPDFAKECDGYLEVFKGKGDMWSFVEPADGHMVKRTTEKDRVSDLCSDGLYYFREKKIFDQCIKDALKKEDTVKGEYYIAPLYNQLIHKGMDIRYHQISSDEIILCGTPEEYKKL